MTNLKLSYVQAFKDRHGRQRFYFRRPGFKRIPLPGLPGSAEFMDAYQAALDGKTAPRRMIGAERTKAGTMNALAVAYYTSANYKMLAPSTQRFYRFLIERLRREHGDKPVAALETRHIRRMLDERAHTPSAANNVLGTLRVLMLFAIERGWRADDPTASVKKLRVGKEGIRTWSDEDIASFEARWACGTPERLALALLLYTAQRRSDVLAMGRQHVRGDTIQVVPQKTANSSGQRLSIPIHPDLAVELARVPLTQLTFLQSPYTGRSWHPGSFSRWFGRASKEAGLLTGCSPHGLRKAAARRLAEAGCSAHVIMSITGHATLKEVARYTAAADQEVRARQGIASLVNAPVQAGTGTESVKPRRKV